MGAPVGAIVGIYYDADVELNKGDALITPTGRVYLIVSLRRQKRGKNIGRWHLRCLIQTEPPKDGKTYKLRWYKRQKKAFVNTWPPHKNDVPF